MQSKLVGLFPRHRFFRLDPEGLSRRRIKYLKDGLAFLDLEEKITNHIHVALQGFYHSGLFVLLFTCLKVLPGGNPYIRTLLATPFPAETGGMSQFASPRV